MNRRSREQAEIQRIAPLYPTTPNKVLAIEFGRTEKAIKNLATRQGWKKDVNYVDPLGRSKSKEPRPPRGIIYTGQTQEERPMPRRKLKDGYRLLVFPDIQFPYHDHRSIQAIYQYLKDAPKFDEFLQMGDFMDFPYVSRWTKANMRFLEGKRFLKDYEKANEFLDELQAVLYKNNKDMKFTMLQGNHDIRPEVYIDAHPEMEGILEMELNLDFEGRGIDYLKTWGTYETYKVGHAEFIHGHYINQHHAAKMVTTYQCPIFYGHTHDIMRFPMTNRSKHKAYVAQSLGTLSVYEMDYMGQRPSNWQQAFTEFVFAADGHFNYYITSIFNHSFVHMNGKKYKG